MVVNRVLRNLGTKSKWLVLEMIYQHPGLSGREIARRVDLSWAPVKEALDDLVDMGLVEWRPVGRAHLYFPNREHLFYPSLEAFFRGLEDSFAGLFEELNLLFRRWGGLLLSLAVFSEKVLAVFEDHSGLPSGLKKELDSLWQRKGLKNPPLELLPLSKVQRELPSLLVAEAIYGLGVDSLARRLSLDEKLSFFDF